MFCKKKLIAIATLLLNSFVIMAQQTPTYFIKAGKFYDSEKNVFLKNQELIVTGGKITAVGTGLQVPKNALVINATDGTVTPGLIDAHTHLLTLQKLTDNLAIDAMMNSGETRVLRGAGMARSFLESGFTAIRDLGNSGYYLDVELKRAIRNKYVPGPKMLVSGPILSAIDGQFFQLPLKEQEKITTSEYRVIKGIED
ncbi:MAG: amidohydrolase family protein, partial [Flavitalea sp.]